MVQGLWTEGELYHGEPVEHPHTYDLAEPVIEDEQVQEVVHVDAQVVLSNAHKDAHVVQSNAQQIQ